jgi:hypothetical protein
MQIDIVKPMEHQRADNLIKSIPSDSDTRYFPDIQKRLTTNSESGTINGLPSAETASVEKAMIAYAAN